VALRTTHSLQTVPVVLWLINSMEMDCYVEWNILVTNQIARYILWVWLYCGWRKHAKGNGRGGEEGEEEMGGREGKKRRGGEEEKGRGREGKKRRGGEWEGARGGEKEGNRGEEREKEGRGGGGLTYFGNFSVSLPLALSDLKFVSQSATS
jgi:hypothetical protein